MLPLTVGVAGDPSVGDEAHGALVDGGLYQGPREAGFGDAGDVNTLQLQRVALLHRVVTDLCHRETPKP